MKKLTGILMAVCLTAALIAGCGQKAGRENTQTTGNQSAAQTESQTAGNQRETGDLSGDEVSAAQHCIEHCECSLYESVSLSDICGIISYIKIRRA